MKRNTASALAALAYFGPPTACFLGFGLLSEPVHGFIAWALAVIPSFLIAFEIAERSE